MKLDKDARARLDRIARLQQPVRHQVTYRPSRHVQRANNDLAMSLVLFLLLILGYVIFASAY